MLDAAGSCRRALSCLRRTLAGAEPRRGLGGDGDELLRASFTWVPLPAPGAA
ncbi:hypothetical protein ABZ628_14365 [Streptomyces diastaticus]|uniref:hypothetical protein n=1 Tax=Streptomyces diastaticus TaxID=1956 RepID=UPI0033C92467